MSEERARRLAAAASPRRATPDDADRLARLLTSAFLTDPVMDWIARPGPKRAAGVGAFFTMLLSRTIPAGEVWMSDDGAACALWLPPGAPTGPRGLVQQLRLLPLFVKLCGFDRLSRGSAMSEAMRAAHPRENHFYLFFIGVDPALQGQGLGAALLDATLKRIDAAGQPAYLENSNPRNARLYERAGFAARPSVSPADAPPLIPMWRNARVAAP
jgi:GNAT superfamily N-acetyltransferase